MSVIAESACSAEFSAALEAVSSQGKSARLASWPAGMCLRKHGEAIAVYRYGKLSAPYWLGPSGGEMSATDWEILE